MITKNVNGENISQAFIDEIRSDSPNIIARLMLGGSELSCDIMNLQVTKGSCGSTELTIGNVIADMLTASVKNLEDTIKGEDIECHIGAWTGEDYEFISLGAFTVSEAKKTRYTTEITAYSSVVGKTATKYVGDNSNPTIGELGQNIANILGCDITFDPAIDTTQIVMAQVLDSSLYQCLQAVAICSGGYIVNDNAGNILVCRYDSTPTLNVDTGMMVSLPQVDEAPIEVDSVKCNGEYPYSAQRNFIIDEQNRFIVDEQDRLFYGYDAIENADIEFDCDYMTKDVFDTNIVDIIGYTYWYATIGLTLGDPRLEGSDVLAVTDVDGTVYNVPCHQLTHSYSGGFKTDIVSAQPTQQQNDIGSVTPLGATQELAFQAYMGNKRTGQYLWFVGDGDDAGLHITSEPKDDFLDNPTGGNLLARSGGLIMRDGLTEKAKFGVDEVTVGETGSVHVSIDPNGLSIKEDSAVLSRFSESEVRIGEETAGHISITPTRMRLYSEDGTSVGATIQNGKIVVGGNSDSGGSISVLNAEGTQVARLNNSGLYAIRGTIADFTIDDNAIGYSTSTVGVNISSNGFITDNNFSNYGGNKWRSTEISQGIIKFLGSTTGREGLTSYYQIACGVSPVALQIQDNYNNDSIMNYRSDIVSTDWTGEFRVWGDFSVAGGGTKSREVETRNYDNRCLYCYETPTPLFGDIGEAVLDESGVCYVDLDDIFSETITTKTEYQVFLQKEGEGDCYVAEKQERYFVIKGTPNLKVAWEIKAKQRDYEHIRLEEPNEYERYVQVNEYVYDYIEEQERLLYE